MLLLKSSYVSSPSVLIFHVPIHSLAHTTLSLSLSETQAKLPKPKIIKTHKRKIENKKRVKGYSAFSNKRPNPKPTVCSSQHLHFHQHLSSDHCPLNPYSSFSYFILSQYFVKFSSFFCFRGVTFQILKL